MNMEALANENFPAPSTRLLREAGWDVKSIKEDMPGISDEEVLRVAVTERRIILTFDRDYGELLFRYRHNPPPAVVYFRNKGDIPESAGKMLLEIIQRQQISLEGYFTVLEESGVRQRQLR
jgi:predicted nuclease of predicted toxin-antitoxin system